MARSKRLRRSILLEERMIELLPRLRIEQVRVGTLLGAEAATGRQTRDVDEDDAAFEAYNRRLADIYAHEHPRATGTDPR